VTDVEIRSRRSPGITYQELLDHDTRDVPAVLRLESPPDSLPWKIPVERYTSADWHRREVANLWSRVWQFACREEHIPEPGDCYIYDIAMKSYLVVRQSDGAIKAFPNACLHRGRRLRSYEGRCSELRCSYHGFTWALDGGLKRVPAAWDFPEVTDEAFHLPEVQVGTWAGFVFINPDPHAPPLSEHLRDLAEHFEIWNLGDMFVEAHVAKVIRANWKVAQEAFCESYHVGATHPQVLPYLGDTNSQVDVWDNCARVLTAAGTPSPLLSWTPTEEDMLRALLDVREGEELPVTMEAHATMRAVAADLTRGRWRPVIGDGVDRMSDAEMMDAIDYTVFPNFHPWGAFNRIVYRFRPNGDDHRTSIMEVLFLSPFSGKRPPPAQLRELGPDQLWTDAPELGMLGKVFNQDTQNMAEVQRGLESTARPTVHVAGYQEAKIAWIHKKLGEWVEGDQ
jgi:phenylpropionate dioxygenase-like ring-hydroxylating dioxygenase large terminal subunit